jgi:hypothetical protein
MNDPGNTIVMGRRMTRQSVRLMHRRKQNYTRRIEVASVSIGAEGWQTARRDAKSPPISSGCPVRRIARPWRSAKEERLARTQIYDEVGRLDQTGQDEERDGYSGDSRLAEDLSFG